MYDAFSFTLSIACSPSSPTTPECYLVYPELLDMRVYEVVH